MRGLIVLLCVMAVGCSGEKSPTYCGSCRYLYELVEKPDKSEADYKRLEELKKEDRDKIPSLVAFHRSGGTLPDFHSECACPCHKIILHQLGAD